MPNDDAPGCLACDLTNSRRDLPGGRIFATAHWVVEHCIGPLRVGTLIVKPLRHCLHVSELTAEESAHTPGWDRVTLPLGHLWDTARRQCPVGGFRPPWGCVGRADALSWMWFGGSVFWSMSATG